MCIAILKTKKGIISDDELRNSFENNSNGAGIAYTKDNELIIEKGFFNVEAFLKAVRDAEKVCDNNMLIHCRISTSGKIDSRNTHPFEVRKNVCLIHNGILDVNVDKNSDINDTQIFINKYLKRIRKYDLMHNKCVQRLIAEAIGTNNKFVMMDNTGYYKIINEQEGEWKDNVWYSNGSYKQKKVKYTWSSKDYDYSSWYNYCDYYDRYYSDYKEGSFGYSQYDRNGKLKISSKMYDEILDKIAQLQYGDFLDIGEVPMYDYANECLISFDQAQYRLATDYLEDLSEDLYEFYIECRNEIMEEYEETVIKDSDIA